MGRIAEALKRAQQERTRRLGQEPTAVAEGFERAPAGPPSPDTRCDPIVDAADVLSRSSILGAPGPPKPFPSRNSPILPECVGPEVVALHDPTSGIAEKYRSVRTRLLTSNPGGGARVFAVTSSLGQEGKTVTTANMGFSLAELRHLRVAIIDLDFRQRGLSRLCRVEDKPGMVEVLRGDKQLADVCLPLVSSNLYFVPTGNAGQASPSELLAGNRVRSIFKELADRFHYSLIDTPPVNTAADIGLIAPLCHSVLIVVRMGRTPEPLLRRCVKTLQANHVAIGGCILAGYCEKTMACSEPHDYYEPA